MGRDVISQNVEKGGDHHWGFNMWDSPPFVCRTEEASWMTVETSSFVQALETTFKSMTENLNSHLKQLICLHG